MGFDYFKTTRRMNAELYSNKSNFDFIFSFKECEIFELV